MSASITTIRDHIGVDPFASPSRRRLLTAGVATTYSPPTIRSPLRANHQQDRYPALRHMQSPGEGEGAIDAEAKGGQTGGMARSGGRSRSSSGENAGLLPAARRPSSGGEEALEGSGSSPSASNQGNSGVGVTSPPLKRSLGSAESIAGGATGSTRKAPKLDPETNAEASSSAQPERANARENEAAWQSPGRYGSGPMAIGSLNTSSQRGGPQSAGGSIEGRSFLMSPSSSATMHGRGRFGEGTSRLPGIASLSARPTSPPPQVARVNAPRSFVSASNAAASSSGFLGSSNRDRALPLPTATGGSHGTVAPPILPSSASGSNPNAGGPLSPQAIRQAGSHPPPLPQPPGGMGSMNVSYMSPSGGVHGGSPSLPQASPAQGCPPIHPSLIGLPGSGTGPGNKQQPSFVAKLYSMLEDEATGNMISWSPSGDVFSVANPAEFSRLILPTWFKHANWQSFVRQLNMYGFHKVNHTFSGAPNEEVQVWEFKHPSFRRGEVQLLADIKRKSSRHKRTGSQSHSFSGSLHGFDFDGRLRSRSSTPNDPYSSSDMPMPSGPVMAEPAMSHDPRLRGYPGEGEFREPLPAHAHARVRSLTDAAMRPPVRGFGQAMHEAEMMRGGPMPERGIGPGSGSIGTLGPPAHIGMPRPAVPPSASAGPGPGVMGHSKSASMTAASGHGMGLPVGEEKVTRIDDLSDRVDAIIRHSNYLENQVRTLSEQFHHSQQNEQTARTQTLRLINRLTNVLAAGTSDQGPRDDGGSGGAGATGSVALQRALLDICQTEISRLGSFIGLEPGSLSPHIAPRQVSGGGASGGGGGGSGRYTAEEYSAQQQQRSHQPHHQAGSGSTPVNTPQRGRPASGGGGGGSAIGGAGSPYTFPRRS